MQDHPTSARQLFIPQRPEDVDAAWLSLALSHQHDRVTVHRVEHEALVHGAGTKLRIKVHYGENPQQLPDVLWIKAGWEAHSELLEQVGTYVKEAHFYRCLAVPSGARAPRCFHASWNDRGQSAIILEDLNARGAQLWDCRVARSVSDVASMLATLAPWHARWWNDPALLQMPLIDVPMRATGPLAEWPRANGAQRLDEMLSGPRGADLPAHIKDGARIERAFWRMVGTLEAATSGCLLHGDPHPGNCFSDADGSAGLYDWQTVARGPWAYDVAYMIVTALSPEDRRAAERDLLVHYWHCLRSHGVMTPFDVNSVWDDYRRYIAYPLLIWPTNHVTHQSEDNIRALTYRLGIAADDFDFFALWGV